MKIIEARVPFRIVQKSYKQNLKSNQSELTKWEKRSETQNCEDEEEEEKKLYQREQKENIKKTEGKAKKH